MLNVEIEVKVHGTNIKYYENLLNRKLTSGMFILVKQTDLPPSSRIKVSCKCDNCGSDFQRSRTMMKTLGRTFCSNKCRSIDLKINNHLYNANIKDKINVSCANCSKSFDVIKSVFLKSKFHLCSRKCYSEHRSSLYKGSNVYNYQDKTVKCSECFFEFKTYKWKSENNNDLFCSQKCYWAHRKKNYHSKYLDDSRNSGRVETAPEKAIREYLIQKGLKLGEDFYQEQGFLKKYYVDFYIPKLRLIIEAYGDYWHVNPEIFDVNQNDSTKKKLNDFQENIIKNNYDSIRESHLKSHGFDFLIVWEKETKDGSYKEKLEKHLTL